MPAKRRALFLAVCMTLLATSTHGEWPTDAATPLVLGNALGFGSEHVVVSTPDGATWIAWIDNQCFASLIVQRIDADGLVLAPGGLVLDTQDDCISLSPRLQALSDNTVVASAVGSDPLTTPVHRIAADGQEFWAPEVVADDGFSGGVQALLALAGGDALVAGRDTMGIRVGRYTANGTRVWNPPATFSSATGSNMRIFALTRDDADGAYVLWDSPGAYTRRVYAIRIDSNGNAAWQAPLLIIDIPPGSSRHTDPVAMADGLGGLVLVWTQGAEQAITPVPIRMQRLFSDGTTAFDMDGARVSTSSSRQFDAQIRQRTPGGDVYVAWRDGPFNDQAIRVQRMTLAGERLWGDTGVFVTSLAGFSSDVAIDWLDAATLGIAITDTPANLAAPRVNLHRVDILGQVSLESLAISDAVPAGAIGAAPLADALAVVWQREGNGSMSELVAQRVNPDGTLGSPPDTDGDGIVDSQDNCTTTGNADQFDSDGDGFGNRCDADLNNDCIVNAIDLGLMKSMFFGVGPDADLNSDGIVNAVDLGLLKLSFFEAPGPSELPNGCEQ